MIILKCIYFPFGGISYLLLYNKLLQNLTQQALIVSRFLRGSKVEQPSPQQASISATRLPAGLQAPESLSRLKDWLPGCPAARLSKLTHVASGGRRTLDHVGLSIDSHSVFYSPTLEVVYHYFFCHIPLITMMTGTTREGIHTVCEHQETGISRSCTRFPGH